MDSSHLEVHQIPAMNRAIQNLHEASNKKTSHLNVIGMQFVGAGMLIGHVRLYYGSQVPVIPAVNTSQQAGNLHGQPRRR